MTKQIEQALKQQNFDLATALYLEWYESSPLDFNIEGSQPSRVKATHIANAANLARRAGFNELQFVKDISPRLGEMVKVLFGLAQPSFSNPLQRPNFIYIPELTSKPFYDIQECEGLKSWIQRLQPFADELLEIGKVSKSKYVEEFENLPNLEEWNKLRDEWFSTHLIKGGEHSEVFKSLSKPLREVLEKAPLAHCPPHAPEMFVSVLEPEAYIPPHYGISNCKLTVHIPLKVTKHASLKAGDEIFQWENEQYAMIFDDSFLHSAKNESDEVRIVLIFDIWHPDLSLLEKEGLAKFMTKFDVWNNGVGKLANLDTQLRRK